MSSLPSHEHIPSPPEADVLDLAKEITSRKMVAEMKLAHVDTHFTEESRFDPRSGPLPTDFTDAVRDYLASPSVDLSTDWPPRPWLRKPKLEETVETFRFPTNEKPLQEDTIFNVIESSLVAVQRKLPGSDPALVQWKRVLKACHRIRTDELTRPQPEEPAKTPDEVKTSKSWASIIVKLHDGRPNGI